MILPWLLRKSWDMFHSVVCICVCLSVCVCVCVCVVYLYACVVYLYAFVYIYVWVCVGVPIVWLLVYIVYMYVIVHLTKVMIIITPLWELTTSSHTSTGLEIVYRTVQTLVYPENLFLIIFFIYVVILRVLYSADHNLGRIFAILFSKLYSYNIFCKKFHRQ